MMYMLSCESVKVECVQIKYREAGKKQASTSLYQQLPETLETRHAKEASQLQSQVQPRLRVYTPNRCSLSPEHIHVQNTCDHYSHIVSSRSPRSVIKMPLRMI